MSVRKSAEFIADVERQFEWYAVQAGWNVGERYLAAVDAICRLVGRHPNLGPCGDFTDPRLRDWRFIVLFPPFQSHLLFYESAKDGVTMRRAVHGHRDLPRTLLEPPGRK